jgi:branched-chain amino acid transport system substrate-binding protein
VVQEGDIFTNKIIGIALENHQDVYGVDCQM